jgi:hypothetical protein
MAATAEEDRRSDADRTPFAPPSASVVKSDVHEGRSNYKCCRDLAETRH